MQLATPLPPTRREHDSAVVQLSLGQQRRPWQEVVEERVKAKTRIISSGPSKTYTPAPSQFSAVCGHFFFPLMAEFDKRLPTLDLLGADRLCPANFEPSCLSFPPLPRSFFFFFSVRLGHLLHTLGTVVHAAALSPSCTNMATSLLDFCWALRYHENA